MSRGNQREQDRAKRQAKLASQNKTTREGTPAQRNQDDAAKLQAKLAAKAAKKVEAENAPKTATKAPVARKKVAAKKTETLDDLLNAGLSTKKSKNKKK